MYPYVFRSFNSNTVRLRQKLRKSVVDKITGFNSNTVRLRLGRLAPAKVDLYSFNSNTVRLRRECGQKRAGLSPFQFQYGTIKAVPRYEQSDDLSEFQFQYGTIKAYPKGGLLAG